MKALLQSLRARLTGRPDSEHAQAFIRVAMLVVVLAYLLATVRGRPEYGAALDTSLRFLLLEFLVALGIVCWLFARPGISYQRRMLGMLADYSLTCVGLHLLGPYGAPLYVIVLWVTVGNGLRYGPNFLYMAIAFGFTTFLSAVLFTPYWRENPWLGWALLTGLVAIPLYLSSLLKALVHATNAARAASEAKSRFLANMSHELRTPLNGIVGMADLMMTSRLSPDQRDSAQVIQTSARALQLLVDDVLDLSTIEAGKFKHSVEDFQLSELLKSVQLMLQTGAQAKGLAFEINTSADVPKLLHGDVNHLRQVLVNLVSNATKFTESGKITLSVSALSAADSAVDDLRLRFSVRDTGIGIPADRLPSLFDAFEQVETGRGRRFGGTGLGTTIAKALTELMGGTIGVESTPEVGSHFWVDLPFGQVDQDVPSVTSSNVIAFSDPFIRHRARVRQMRILVADDQSSNLMVMRQLLEKAGHRSQIVNDGEDVLNAIEVHGFDAVIIDLHMPGISGLDVIKQARFMQAGMRRTPFIVLSADATTEARVECERAGAYAFMTKPLMIDKLLEHLAAIAEGGEMAAAAPARRQAQAPASPAEISQTMLDELREIGLGEEFVARFLVECARDARKCLVDLDAAGKAQSREAFCDAAHALKGTASNMGATLLAANASDAMQVSDDRLRRDWRGIVNLLREQLEQALSALRQRGDLVETLESDGSDSGA